MPWGGELTSGAPSLGWLPYPTASIWLDSATGGLAGHHWGVREKIRVLIPLSLLAFHGPGEGFPFHGPNFCQMPPSSARGVSQAVPQLLLLLGVYG